jgi:macrolide-specific efflux system membrane fusion protein
MNTVKNICNRLFSWFAGLSWLKKMIISIVVVGLLGFAAVKVYSQQNTKPQYQTAQVARGSIISTVTESGNVSSTSQISVGSPADGVLEEVYVKNGDKITAGQNLFKVKATATPQEQASAYASYLTAVNSAKSAEQSKQALQASLEKDRQAVLDAQNAVDFKNNNSTNPSTKQGYTQLEQQSIDSALTNAHESFTADETKYNQADSAIAAAKAQLNSASLAYQATQNSVVTAPVDGTIANLSAEVGSAVSSSGSSSSSSNSNSNSSSSSSSSSSSPVLIIGNFTKLSIKAEVSEVDIAKVHIGEKATLTLDAFPDKTYVGEVASVDSVGTSTSGVVSYNAYINITEPPTTIQSGMTASAVIQTDRKDDTLSVPSAAVHTTDGQSTVLVLKNGKQSSVDVTTGITSDTNTEITSGLSEGETVITGQATTTGASSTTASPFGARTNAGFGGGFSGAGRTGGMVRIRN